MVVQSLAFYLFAFITIVAGVMVISARDPVHSVLFLILAFFNSAGLFVLLGAEFLAMILVAVYVGAVAVLFLFVVMMLDIDFVELRQGFPRYLPIGALIGLILLGELAAVAGAWVVAPDAQAVAGAPTPPIEETHNTEAIGNVLYTDYVYLFQASGLVLLVAMIGAIVLTLRQRDGARRQSSAGRIGKKRDETVERKDVASGSGV